MEENKREVIEDSMTFAIIGCAMRVHHELGPGFQEVIYQRCLAIELQLEGLQFAREESQVIHYKGRWVGKRRADFVVAKRIVVEIKAQTKLEDAHLAQCKNYTVVYDFEIGLLFNFGGKSLEYKRVFNPKYNKKVIP